MSKKLLDVYSKDRKVSWDGKELKAINSRVVDSHEEDIEYLSHWLEKLKGLEWVPFPHLVADERMLPPDGLRFFYIDPNWQKALEDGALSTMVHCEKDLRLDETCIRPVLAAKQSNRKLLHSGMIIRSALVSGWPGLSVEASKDGKEVSNQLVRRLSKDVLMIIFQGVPDEITLREPESGFRFGYQDNNKLVLRRLKGKIGQKLTDIDIGIYLGHNGFMGRVDVVGLRSALEEKLVKNDQLDQRKHLTPATFGLQLMKNPQQLVLKMKKTR